MRNAWLGLINPCEKLQQDIITQLEIMQLDFNVLNDSTHIFKSLASRCHIDDSVNWL